VARYRTKDEVDLTWNKIRRRITGELRMQFADVFEEMLNELLGEAFTRYEKAIASGERIELDAEQLAFVNPIIEGRVHVSLEQAERAAA